MKEQMMSVQLVLGSVKQLRSALTSASLAMESVMVMERNVEMILADFHWKMDPLTSMSVVMSVLRPLFHVMEIVLMEMFMASTVVKSMF